MESSGHFLLAPRALAALAVFGAFGVGVSLIAPQLFLLGLLICLGSAGATIWLYWNELSHFFSLVARRRAIAQETPPPRDVWAAIALIVIEFVVIGALIFSRKSEVGTPTAKDIADEVAKVLPTVGNSDLEPRVFIECDFGAFPTVAPPSGKIYFMEINAASAEWGGAGLAYFFGSAGSIMGFGPGQLAYQCKLTNYSAAPVFNVELLLSLTFTKALTVPGQPNSRQMGALRVNREWLIVIPSLDADKDNPFVFYIRSTSSDFVDVSPPKDVTLQQGADHRRRTVHLIVPLNTSITLLPSVENKK